MIKNQTQALLLDLDGTLLDTAPDLVASVNVLLRQQGQAPKDFHLLRPWVSQGGLKMISVAFDIPVDSEEANNLWKQYLIAYQGRIVKETRPFPGCDTVLNWCAEEHISWGIVTNKPEYLTHQIVEQLGLTPTNNCIVCGDTLTVQKPAPDPVLHACQILDVDPKNAIMVGDDQRDITSGKLAGTKTIAAKWGYLVEGDNPDDWQADIVISSPIDIIDWIKRQ